jgi:hypothetical protein
VRTRLAVMSLGLFVLTGCSKMIVGKWTVDTTPELKNAKNIIQRIEFTGDGMFKADMIEAKQKVAKVGKYNFNGFQLKLSTKEGDQVWNAMIIMNKTLDLKRSGDHIKLTKTEK